MGLTDCLREVGFIASETLASAVVIAGLAEVSDELLEEVVTLAAEEDGLEDSEFVALATMISQISKDVAFFITLVNVSSEEVKMPSSARWLVEAELVEPAIEEATEEPAALPPVAIFRSKFKPRSVGV